MAKKINFLTINQGGKITESQKQNDCAMIGIATPSFWLKHINNNYNIKIEKGN